MQAARMIAAVVLWITALAVPPAAQQPPGKPANPDKPFTLQELEKKVWHLSFPDGKRAELQVTSENEGDVDLFVEEMDGTEVAEDTDPSKDCILQFLPDKEKTYRVSIVNVGQGQNKCVFTHNGKVVQPDFGKTVETKPFPLFDDAEYAIKVNLTKGKWAAVWVFSTKATDVDVFIVDPDGNEIAADEHVSRDAFVSFLPETSGTYRIEVHNLGPGENECRIKHSVSPPDPQEK